MKKASTAMANPLELERRRGHSPKTGLHSRRISSGCRLWLQSQSLVKCFPPLA